ncbi:MAG: phosphatase PAP2 family protein [Pseudonocardiaceae bacterium]
MRRDSISVDTRGGSGMLLVAAVLVTGVLLGESTPPLDTWMVDHWYVEPGTGHARIATVVSGVGTLAVISALVVALTALALQHKRPRLWLRYLVLLTAGLATVLLQMVFQRAGPPVTAQDWTYPSGHVVIMTAVAFTAVAAHAMTPSWSIVVTAVGTLGVLAVAASRVTLGEHYFIDVVAAAVATVGVGLLATRALGLPGRRQHV